MYFVAHDNRRAPAPRVEWEPRCNMVIELVWLADAGTHREDFHGDFHRVTQWHPGAVVSHRLAG